jgi:hypothetical protein
MEAYKEEISLLEIAIPKHPRKFDKRTPEVTSPISNS